VADTPPLPELDPLFLRCLKEAAANPEFVAEFDRLTSSNLSMRGSPLELAIDREAGRTDAELGKFVWLVWRAVFVPLTAERRGGIHG